MALGGLNTMFRERPAYENRPVIRSEPISAPMGLTSSIPISGIPRLVINVGNTPVHIHTGGDANRVLLQTTVEGDNTDAGTIAHAMNVIPIASDTGTIVQVTANRAFSGDDSRIADLDITVADKADIIIHSTDGAVDINGQINVVSSEGQVNVNNAQGQLNIQNEDGKVAINQFTGQVQLTTGDASIDMNNVKLSGSSSMKTVDGSFSFNGSLAAGGIYSIESRNGSVDVTLPADSSFQLVTATSGGSLQNDFGSSTVGSAPYSTLSIRTADGSIGLHEK